MLFKAVVAFSALLVISTQTRAQPTSSRRAATTADEHQVPKLSVALAVARSPFEPVTLAPQQSVQFTNFRQVGVLASSPSVSTVSSQETNSNFQDQQQQQQQQHDADAEDPPTTTAITTTTTTAATLTTTIGQLISTTSTNLSNDSKQTAVSQNVNATTTITIAPLKDEAVQPTNDETITQKPEQTTTSSLPLTTVELGEPTISSTAAPLIKSPNQDTDKQPQASTTTDKPIEIFITTTSNNEDSKRDAEQNERKPANDVAASTTSTAELTTAEPASSSSQSTNVQVNDAKNVDDVENSQIDATTSQPVVSDTNVNKESEDKTSNVSTILPAITTTSSAGNTSNEPESVTEPSKETSTSNSQVSISETPITESTTSIQASSTQPTPISSEVTDTNLNLDEDLKQPPKGVDIEPSDTTKTADKLDNQSSIAPSTTVTPIVETTTATTTTTTTAESSSIVSTTQTGDESFEPATNQSTSDAKDINDEAQQVGSTQAPPTTVAVAETTATESTTEKAILEDVEQQASKATSPTVPPTTFTEAPVTEPSTTTTTTTTTTVAPTTASEAVVSTTEKPSEQSDKACSFLPTYNSEEVQKVFREETTFKNGTIKGKFTYINFDNRYRLVHYTRLPYGPVKIDFVDELGRPQVVDTQGVTANSPTSLSSTLPSGAFSGENSVLQIRNILPNSLYGFPFVSANSGFGFVPLAAENKQAMLEAAALAAQQQQQQQQQQPKLRDPNSSFYYSTLANDAIYSNQEPALSFQQLESLPQIAHATQPLQPKQQQQQQQQQLLPQTIQPFEFEDSARVAAGNTRTYGRQLRFDTQADQQQAAFMNEFRHQPHAHEHFIAPFMLEQGEPMQRPPKLKVKTSKALQHHGGEFASRFSRLQAAPSTSQTIGVESINENQQPTTGFVPTSTRHRQRVSKQNQDLSDTKLPPTTFNAQPVVYHVQRADVPRHLFGYPPFITPYAFRPYE